MSVVPFKTPDEQSELELVLTGLELSFAEVQRQILESHLRKLAQIADELDALRERISKIVPPEVCQ